MFLDFFVYDRFVNQTHWVGRAAGDKTPRVLIP